MNRTIWVVLLFLMFILQSNAWAQEVFVHNGVTYYTQGEWATIELCSRMDDTALACLMLEDETECNAPRHCNTYFSGSILSVEGDTLELYILPNDSCWRGTYKLIDISDPAQIMLISSSYVTHHLEGKLNLGYQNYRLLFDDPELRIFDVSNGQPEYVTNINEHYYWDVNVFTQLHGSFIYYYHYSDFYVSNPYECARGGDGTFYLRIYDMAQPSIPRILTGSSSPDRESMPGFKQYSASCEEVWCSETMQFAIDNATGMGVDLSTSDFVTTTGQLTNTIYLSTTEFISATLRVTDYFTAGMPLYLSPVYNYQAVEPIYHPASSVLLTSGYGHFLGFEDNGELSIELTPELSGTDVELYYKTGEDWILASDLCGSVPSVVTDASIIGTVCQTGVYAVFDDPDHRLYLPLVHR